MNRSEYDPVYDPEAQAYGALSAQEKGLLTLKRCVYYGCTSLYREKLEWIILHYGYKKKYGRVHLLGIDCNKESLIRLKTYNPLLIISGQQPQPEIFDGRQWVSAGAVLSGRGEVIYRSGLFQLEQFIAQYQEKGRKPDKKGKLFL